MKTISHNLMRLVLVSRVMSSVVRCQNNQSVLARCRFLSLLLALQQLFILNCRRRRRPTAKELSQAAMCAVCTFLP